MNDLKIGTLTFHNAANYGAVLQAYALPAALQKLGYDCEVIDYRHPFISKDTDIEWPCDLRKRYGWIKGNIKAINRWRLGWYCKNNRYVQYSLFVNRDLPKSKKIYHSPADIASENYDVILFGSDQIWNESLTNGLSPTYFGDFVSDSNKTVKIAYAASNGRDFIPTELRTKIEPWLKSFAALGIREKGLAEFIRNEYNLQTETVVDPVLLLDKKAWNGLEGKLPRNIYPGQYIFVYTFDEQPVYDFARKLAHRTGLQMVLLRWCGKNDRFNDMIQLSESSPAEFLALIHNAAYVCTSSFHGTAFSVVFEKEFYCYSPDILGSRTDNLLNLLEIEDHRIRDNTDAELRNLLDYEKISNKLEELRSSSVGFLRDSLERCK